MGSTFHSVTVHVIFTCKERRALITPEINDRLYPYIGGILRNRHCTLLEGGGIENHVHLLIGAAPRHAISDVLRDIKSNTSKWIHETWPKHEFAWQEGHGVFSVSISHIEKTKACIRNQPEHHKKHSFEDEQSQFKKLHGLMDQADGSPSDSPPEATNARSERPPEVPDARPPDIPPEASEPSTDGS